MNEVTENRRRWRNEKFRDCSLRILWAIKSRRTRWVWNVARMGDRRGACRVLVGVPEGIRPLGRPRRRWEDNVKMYFKEIECVGAE